MGAGGTRSRQWFLAAVGVALLVVVLVQLLAFEGRRTAATLEVAVPLVAALCVLGAGATLARSEYADRMGRIAGWSLLGAATLGLLGAWNGYLDVLAGASLEEAAYAVTTEASVGAVVGALVGFYDARQRGQRAELRERERELRTVVDNVPVVLFAFDADGRITLTEGRGLSALGVEAGELVGDSVFDVYGDYPATVEACRRALGGEAVDATVEIGERAFDAWLEPVEGPDGEVTSVIGTALDVTERAERERTLAELHAATRAMVQETEAAAVCDRAAVAAGRILDMPVNAVWMVDETGTELLPVAWGEAATDLFAEMPTFAAAEPSLAWRAYEDGEALVFDDVHEHPGRYNEESPIRSEIIVPLGDAGVLITGSTDPGAFDETDVLSARLLGANVGVALERAERERELRIRNDQMAFFTSILRHDVLNGMTVVRARAEMLADELDGERGQWAETIVEWSDDVTDVVGRVRTVLDAITGTADRSFEPVDLSAVVREECARVAGTYASVTVETDVPPGVEVLADELLAEIVGNVLTNAVEHNESEGLCVRASVEQCEDRAVLRIADDGRGVPDERKESVFGRGEAGPAASPGSGFGLFFVDAMVEAYGGEVRVEDNDAGGATFVVELPTPDAGARERRAADERP